MKTPKQDMTINNAVKNIIGFGLIVLIVPPFFGTIVKMNQPTESNQAIEAAGNRIKASLDRANQSTKEAEEKAETSKVEAVKTPSYSIDLERMIETYNTANRMHIDTVNKYNADIDLMNTYNQLRTPARTDLANEAKAAIDKTAANLEVVKKVIEKKMALEGFAASLELDEKAPAVKVVEPISIGAVEVVAPVEAEDPVVTNILNHYQNSGN